MAPVYSWNHRVFLEVLAGQCRLHVVAVVAVLFSTRHTRVLLNSSFRLRCCSQEERREVCLVGKTQPLGISLFEALFPGFCFFVTSRFLCLLRTLTCPGKSL